MYLYELCQVCRVTSSDIMDPHTLTVAALKDILARNKLKTTGTKAELVSRMMEFDPTSSWVNAQIVNNDEIVDNHNQASMTVNIEESASPVADDRESLRREIDFMRRESALTLRELELVRRENELLRLQSNSEPRSTQSFRLSEQTLRHPMQTESSVSKIRDLIADFDGSSDTFQNFEKQIRLLKNTYNLDENTTRILIASKLRDRAQRWFHSKPDFIEMDVESLLREMRTMFDVSVDRVTRRRRFESRVWKAAESFNDYAHEKIILANKVPIDNAEIVEHIIEGIPVTSIRNQAHMQRFDTIEELLKGFEKISMRFDSKSTLPKHEGSEKRPTANGPNKSEYGDQRGAARCYNCNMTGHLAAVCKDSPRERTCFKCKKTGHLSRDCPSSTVSQEKKQQEIHNIDKTQEAEGFWKMVQFGFNNSGNVHYITTEALLDTGSPISFVKMSVVPTAVKYECCELSNRYSGINNVKLDIKGIVPIKLTIDGVTQENIGLYIVSNDTMHSVAVIGRDILKLFGIKLTGPSETLVVDTAVNEIMNIDSDHGQRESDHLQINPKLSYDICRKVRMIFENDYVNTERPSVPKVQTALTLTLKDSSPFHYTPRRLSFTEKEKLRDILDNLLQKGIIRPSSSDYASPIVLVKKKTGELRLCVDYRTLNKMIARDNYPMPLIEDLIDALSEKRYFSLLDLRDGFHQISVAEESIKYTAFVTPFGQYEYCKMPFGLKTAPLKFQRYVNDVLADLIKTGDIVAYMDDFLIATRTIEEHFEVLRKAFRLLVENKLELRIDKCEFLQTEINYLGYHISERGVSPASGGVEAIAKYPVPQDVRGVQSFLGMCTYFRKFVQGFSIIAAPLYELLRKNSDFRFGKEQLQAFEMLKHKLMSAPVIAIYSPHDQTELHTDASSIGFGAILLQRKKIDDKWHPVFYFSKRASETEGKMHSFELETLAIVYALRRFRVYLYGIKFKIVTDCNSVALTLKKKDVNPRIARWALEMSNFDYTIEHKSGNNMRHVDALSREHNIIHVIEDNSMELNLAIKQGKDAKIVEIKKLLEESESSRFEMRNGIIYRKKDDRLLFYVPESMQSSVIRRYHDDMGHLSPEKVCSIIQQNYWFPRMSQEVKTYIQNCLKCLAFSPSAGKFEGLLNNIPKGDTPFQTLHVDHLGPVEKNRLKQHILVVVDSFTKFTKLYAVKSTTSRETIDCLKQYFANYSRPRVLISDRGSCFTSSEFREFIQECNIRHVLVATASPRANGQVERVNRVLGPMIAKLTDNDQKRYWYRVLGEVEYALNNSTHKTTKETPSKLLFGVKQRGEIVDGVSDYLDDHLPVETRDLEEMRSKAAQKIIENQTYNKTYVDKHRKQPNVYDIGDYVMIKNFEATPGASKKLIPKFRGPYVVKKCLRFGRYVVGDVENCAITQKPYEGVWEAANMKLWCT